MAEKNTTSGRAVVFPCPRVVCTAPCQVCEMNENARSALKISDHAIVLELGQTCLAGKADRVLHDPGIGQLFLGGAMEETAT